jgi:uncharacterized protein (TIGR00730 family)
MICTKDIFKVFWGYQRAAFFVVRGIFALASFKMPLVAFFGGKNMPHEGLLAQQASLLAHRLAMEGCAILSGGGPGLMQAANCGAQKAAQEKGDGKQRTLGIGVDDLDSDYKNGCGSPFIRAPYFFVRKWLLINYTEAFIIFPGGIGTVDELFEVLNLMKVGTLPIRPIVLIGVDFWQPLMSWIKRSTELGYIPERCDGMIMVTDDHEEAFKHVIDSLHKK